MGHAAWIALGSNLGDRKAHLDAALSRLASVPRVTLLGVSAYHATSPIGGPSGQEPFLNAAAGLATTRSPHDLLAQLHAIEDAEGRVRTERWGARTLDLDLLLWDDQTIEPDLARGSTLVVPHPWLPFRRFVLAPLAEIAPTVVDPNTGQTVSALLANIDRRPSCVTIDDRTGDWGDELYPRLVSALGAMGITCSPVDRGPHEFQPEHSSDNRNGEQWVVSNFRYPHREGERDFLPPTFIVAAGSVEKTWSTGTPRLRVDIQDTGAALEKVLAACAATRA